MSVILVASVCGRGMMTTVRPIRLGRGRLYAVLPVMMRGGADNGTSMVELMG